VLPAGIMLDSAQLNDYRKAFAIRPLSSAQRRMPAGRDEA
jgi:hypothetical protein